MGKVHRGNEPDAGESESGAEADQTLSADRIDVHKVGEGDGQRHWRTLGEEGIKPCRLVCRSGLKVFIQSSVLVACQISGESAACSSVLCQITQIISIDGIGTLIG